MFLEMFDHLLKIKLRFFLFAYSTSQLLGHLLIQGFFIIVHICTTLLNNSEDIKTMK
jgi:hypothetical protein